jgi:Leucine-rich repeat (LRR) protein
LVGSIVFNNSLTGTIPSVLGTMTSLKTIAVTYNRLNGSIPNFSSLTKLTLFAVDNNAIDGTIPSFVGLWPLLAVLNINNNRLTGTIPMMMMKWFFYVPYNGLVAVS